MKNQTADPDTSGRGLVEGGSEEKKKLRKMNSGCEIVERRRKREKEQRTLQRQYLVTRLGMEFPNDVKRGKNTGTPCRCKRREWHRRHDYGCLRVIEKKWNWRPKGNTGEDERQELWPRR